MSPQPFCTWCFVAGDAVDGHVGQWGLVLLPYPRTRVPAYIDSDNTCTPTTLLRRYHLLLLAHPKFVEGDVDTGFIPKYQDDLTEPPVLPEKDNKVIKAAKRAAKRNAAKKAMAP